MNSVYKERSLAFLLILIGIGIAATPCALAQKQSYYTGTNVTGQLTLTNVVNALQAANAAQLQTVGQLGSEINLNASKQFPPPPLQPQVTTTPQPAMQSLPVATATGFGFPGMAHSDMRNANGGNQYSIEPPSQGLAVANGYVVEGVNNAFQIYSTSGSPLLPVVISTNQLFGVTPAINRTTGVVGVNPTDVRAFYDPDIQRWFLLQRVQANTSAGTELAQSNIYIAVSQTSDPTGNYNIYSIDTTDANDPYGDCPCISDYPQIGADQNGIYISANEYDMTPKFVDATVIAISKASLAAGALSPTTYKLVIPDTSGYEFAIQPATTPSGGTYYQANGGVEFFLSGQSSFSNNSAMAIYALSNTSSLATSAPSLTMTEVVVPTLTYVYPNPAKQKPGPTPLASSFVPPAKLETLDGGDTRILSLSYVGGRLYGTVQTQVTDENGTRLVGGAYVILSPTFRGGTLAAPVLRQGYLMVKNNNLLRPAIGVNAQGEGAIVFTLVGPDYYPSAAYVSIDTFATGTSIQLAAAGTAPEDGFSGYSQEGGGSYARWGDYGAAVSADDGSIWMGTEYIPGTPRTELANWGTYLEQYVPSTIAASSFLNVSVRHTGNFIQGQNGAAYTVTVSNQIGAGLTSGLVTVTDTIPAGMTLVSMAGTGWTCVANSCTRGDALAGGESYPVITVTVNVSTSATSSQVNSVSVSGGGSSNVTTTDTTTVTGNPPILSVSLTHNGAFAKGQQNVTYQVVVSNASGAGPTSGLVIITETAPNGLAILSLAGTGWTCPNTLVCTRSDVLAAGASYPPITVTANISVTAPTQILNQVSVSGGGASTVSAGDPAVLFIAVTDDFDDNGVPDLVWSDDATGQVTVHYYGGSGGASLIGWKWLNQTGVAGWHVVAVADFNGDGIPDLVWQNDTTRQVTVHYYGGVGGATDQGWNWLNQFGLAGWHVVAAADFNSDGVPDLVWQNDTTREVLVDYYGGTGGSVNIGSAVLDPGVLGWSVKAAADFDGNGTPDLVWQNDTTRQVTVHYYGGTGGATYMSWAWLNKTGAPGWSVKAALDFDKNGTPDLVWQNDTTRQVTVHYYGGVNGSTYQSWNWLQFTSVPGWSVVN
jgi:uncharacterized repeat protein (TIGR01451 family)